MKKKPASAETTAKDKTGAKTEPEASDNPPSDASCKKSVAKTCKEAPSAAECKEIADSSKVKDSFNIGIGLMMDPSVKILGDGINENEPLPAGETTVRTRETSQWGVLFMVSYNF